MYYNDLAVWSQEAAVDEEVREKETCSWGPLRPSCCRPLLNIKMVLLVLCLISAMQVRALICRFR